MGLMAGPLRRDAVLDQGTLLPRREQAAHDITVLGVEAEEHSAQQGAALDGRGEARGQARDAEGLGVGGDVGEGGRAALVRKSARRGLDGREALALQVLAQAPELGVHLVAHVEPDHEEARGRGAAGGGVAAVLGDDLREDEGLPGVGGAGPAAADVRGVGGEVEGHERRGALQRRQAFGEGVALLLRHTQVVDGQARALPAQRHLALLHGAQQPHHVHVVVATARGHQRQRRLARGALGRAHHEGGDGPLRVVLQRVARALQVVARRLPPLVHAGDAVLRHDRHHHHHLRRREQRQHLRAPQPTPQRQPATTMSGGGRGCRRRQHDDR
mmetsp:Transcript_5462/g.19933  ORF Transcript_5462/g.19933 Transcript_5462/m.19933 type:complete len:329 (+) Transcript_5462:1959-2945(+)